MPGESSAASTAAAVHVNVEVALNEIGFALRALGDQAPTLRTELRIARTVLNDVLLAADAELHREIRLDAGDLSRLSGVPA